MRSLALPRLALAAIGEVLHGQAVAEDFPDRPITLMVPLAPGGGMDFIARTIGQKLSERLGKPVLVENRPGGGTVVATVALAKAPPDGYTLLLVPGSTLTTNATVYKSLPYDPRKDFVPIALTSQVAFALVVNPSLPVHSIAELIKYAKEKARRADRRHGGHRDHDASGRRAARAHDRHQAPVCALPRQPAGDERRRRRQHPDVVRRSGHRRGARQGRKGPRDRGHVEEPHQRVSRRSADRRHRPRLRSDQLAHGDRAGAHAAGRRREALGGIQGDRRDAGGQAADRQDRPGAAGQPACRRSCGNSSTRRSPAGASSWSRSVSPGRCNERIRGSRI